MERTVRRSGRLFFGDTPCGDADEAYRAFRNAYHESLGRKSYRRLDAKERKERVHGFRAYFTDEYGAALESEFGSVSTRVLHVKVLFYMLGIAVTSYCRIASSERMPDYEEERFFRWLDWMMMHSDRTMRTVSLRDNSGRGSTNRKKYR